MAITTYAELQTSIAGTLSYDKASGDFVWLKSGRGRFKRAGMKAGSERPDGYQCICVDGKQWLSHRLAWVMHYGEEPPEVIDHIDRNKSNNAISNLRDGSGGINEHNAKTPKNSPFGIRGVRAASKKGHYQAYVVTQRKLRPLYHGADFFEACCARKSWDAKYWSEKQCR